MKLPQMQYADGIRKRTQTQFGGLNRNHAAQDGEICAMRNLTSDYAPLLATRQKRRLLRRLERPNGIFAWDGLAWADGETFYFRGTAAGTVTDTRKRFAALGPYIVILPDKAYYNTETGEFGTLESSWEGGQITLENGTLYGEEAEANTLEAPGVQWEDWFRVGDAVTISGCSNEKNNKTPVIREIEGNKLRFYENVFDLTKDGLPVDQITETGTIRLKREVPDLQFICENENRLWGCDGRTIYASKLGDIFNWNVFDGLDTDSYAVETGSAGAFTACCSYLGYPIFFKEDHIYKVYGSLPKNFEVMGAATLGVAAGCDRSLAVAGETLFYLSTSGMIAYAGGIPQPCGQAFGLERYRAAVGGSDGLKYYVSMQDAAGESHMFAYDVQRHMWHEEDGTRALGFARAADGNACMMTEDGIWLIGTIWGTDGEEEADFPWMAEFADFTQEDPNAKGISKLQIRLELDEGAVCRVWIRYDSEGEWEQVDELPADVKRSYYLPVVPRRCDHFRLRFEGVGGCRIWSLVQETYSGSELRTKQGRN